MLLIGDKTVTRCSFIMFSLEPHEHLGHISGIVVNFFFFFATERKVCLYYSKNVLHWKGTAGRGVESSLVHFHSSLFQIQNHIITRISWEEI